MRVLSRSLSTRLISLDPNLRAGFGYLAGAAQRDVVAGRHGGSSVIPGVGVSKGFLIQFCIAGDGAGSAFGRLSREGFNQSTFSKHLPRRKEIEL